MLQGRQTAQDDEADEYNITNTYEMWRISAENGDMVLQRLSQRNFGDQENWQTHDTYLTLEREMVVEIYDKISAYLATVPEDR